MLRTMSSMGLLVSNQTKAKSHTVAGFLGIYTVTIQLLEIPTSNVV